MNNDKLEKSLLDLLLEAKKVDIKPNNIRDLSHVPAKELSSSYREIIEIYKNEEMRILGTMLNAIVTSNMPVFIFSKKILEELVQKDDNLKKKSINSKEYKKLFKILLDSNIMGVLIKPSSFHDKKKLVGLYYLKLERMYSSMEDFETHALQIIDAYFDYQGDNIVVDKQIIIDKYLKSIGLSD